MYSAFRNVGLLLCIVAAHCLGQSTDLRVCADPDNLPFSNSKQEGFENQIASLVANDLRAHLQYVWQRMGRGFVREYLDKGKCDLVVGVPFNFRPVLTTSPYYRSSYVFVSRRDRALRVTSFDSPVLRRLKIGVQVLDENYTPPGPALARRGLQTHIVGFDTTGSGADSIVRAVATGQVDLAVIWGPLAGYFASKWGSRLVMAPVEPQIDPPSLPFTFQISFGVRKQNTTLRDQLNQVLLNRKQDIRRILNNYGVPQLPLMSEAVAVNARN